MRIARLDWTVFRLPLRASFETAGGAVTEREGIVVRLVTDGGVAGLGEASALPGAPEGALAAIVAALEDIAPELASTDVERFVPPAPSAVACAIDTAACDALARDRGINVARLLCDSPRTRIAVNATIAARSTADAAAQAAAARDAGFTCVKLKVGMAPSLDDERGRAAAVRTALGPDVALRIDANGAWDADEAIATIQALAPYGIELVEQPVAPGRLEELARVRAAAGVRIAADEDVTGVEPARRVLEADAADVLVIKPMRCGGLRPAMEIASLAASAGVAVIVTTTVDSAVGTAAALQLAAALPETTPACGLATGELFADDIATPPLAVRGGVIDAPTAPGLGVELDEERLRRYAVDSGDTR